MGRRFRLMTEGLVHLLRMRAQEKGSARVAQTMIGAANVNPLKFTVTTEDAVAALVTAKGAGYLEPDAAIAAALHDLMDHHKRSWTGLQSSLAPDDRPVRPRHLRGRDRGCGDAERRWSRAAALRGYGSFMPTVTARLPRPPRTAFWARSGRIFVTPMKMKPRGIDDGTA